MADTINSMPGKLAGMKENPQIERDFVSAIILKAIDDYCTRPQRRDEVREFFKSEWGEELCLSINLDADDILERLESGKINIKTIKGWV